MASIPIPKITAIFPAPPAQAPDRPTQTQKVFDKNVSDDLANRQETLPEQKLFVEQINVTTPAINAVADSAINAEVEAKKSQVASKNNENASKQNADNSAVSMTQSEQFKSDSKNYSIASAESAAKAATFEPANYALKNGELSELFNASMVKSTNGFTSGNGLEMKVSYSSIGLSNSTSSTLFFNYESIKGIPIDAIEFHRGRGDKQLATLYAKDFIANGKSLAHRHICLVRSLGTGSPNELVTWNIPASIPNTTSFTVVNPFGVGVPVLVVMERLFNGAWQYVQAESCVVHAGLGIFCLAQNVHTTSAPRIHVIRM